MGDLLIRDIPDGLKRDLQALAQASGRSLSEETKRILQKGLAAEREGQVQTDSDPYMQFRQAFEDALLGDDEHQAMMDALDAWKDETRPPGAEAAE